MNEMELLGRLRAEVPAGGLPGPAETALRRAIEEEKTTGPARPPVAGGHARGGRGGPATGRAVAGRAGWRRWPPRPRSPR